MNQQKESSLCSYLQECLTPWHFESYIQKQLRENGSWHIAALSDISRLEKKKNHFFHKNGFGAGVVLPNQKVEQLRIFVTHTDSPSLKVKQRGISIKEGMSSLSCDIYGAPILASWVGIPLQITGKVWANENEGGLVEWLIPEGSIRGFIPHLAIHLNRGVNESGFHLNTQNHLTPLVSIDGSKSSFESLLFADNKLSSLLFHDLFVIPMQQPQVVDDMLLSPRLDNLSSSWALFHSMIDIEPRNDGTAQIFLFCNHEEVGSETTEGAYSALISDLVDVIIKEISVEERIAVKSRSIILSCDAAHGAHPIFPEKQDGLHPVSLGKGVAIKLNSNQRYSTPPKRITQFLSFLQQEKIPYQFFTARNDIPCGSTVGPIISSRLGIDAIDIGVPILGMHAAIEMGSLSDVVQFQKMIREVAISY